MNDSLSHERWMRYALNEAVKAYENDEVPVGAIIIKDNQIITLGIRPHKIDFNSNSSNIEGNTKIFTSHWLGDQMHVGMDINNTTVIGVADRDFNLNSDNIKINFPSQSLNAFEKDTEEVIFNGL